MRLTVAGPFDPAKAASGVKRRIADAAALPDFEALAAAVKEARALVRLAYRRVLGPGREANDRFRRTRTIAYFIGASMAFNTSVNGCGLTRKRPE